MPGYSVIIRRVTYSPCRSPAFCERTWEEIGDEGEHPSACFLPGDKLGSSRRQSDGATFQTQSGKDKSPLIPQARSFLLLHYSQSTDTKASARSRQEEPVCKPPVAFRVVFPRILARHSGKNVNSWVSRPVDFNLMSNGLWSIPRHDILGAFPTFRSVGVWLLSPLRIWVFIVPISCMHFPLSCSANQAKPWTEVLRFESSVRKMKALWRPCIRCPCSKVTPNFCCSMGFCVSAPLTICQLCCELGRTACCW